MLKTHRNINVEYKKIVIMKKCKPQILLSLLIICFLLISNYSKSQISGTYTIGGAGSDYEDFDDAISALENEGIGGDIQFLVGPGDILMFQLLK
jgi:hypothetical protein